MQRTTVAASMVCDIFCLGVTQIVIGLLTLALGIGATARLHENYWLTKSGGGIWGGLWILVTGIIGVCSAAYRNSGNFHGTHIAFSIISTVVVFVDFIFFAYGLGYYDNCRPYGYYYTSKGSTFYHDTWTYCKNDESVGVAIYACLLTLMVVEFFVALTASLCLCSVCSSDEPASEEVVIQPEPRQYLIRKSTGETVVVAFDCPV